MTRIAALEAPFVPEVADRLAAMMPAGVPATSMTSCGRPRATGWTSRSCWTC
jgi:hypothetical protein